MTEETRSLVHRSQAAFPGDASALLNRFNDKDPPRSVAAAETLKYEVELITPLFGGGVKPGENDPELPVRMKGLRGQLRFWWRLLAAYGGLAECGLEPLANSAELYAAEAARWGGADENGKPIPGRIGLRVLNRRGFDNPVKFEQRNVQTGKYGTAPQFREPTRAIDYALFPAKHGEQDGSDPKKLILPKAWVGQNDHVSCFTLEIWVHAGDAPDASQIAQELRCTVAWWATFGGIGARWRRGVGSVRVRDEDEKQILCVLDDDPANSSSLPTWASTGGMLLGARRDCHPAKRAWIEAVGRLKAFRQDPGTGRNTPGRFSPFGRSFWPEADLIRDHHGPIPGQVHTPRSQFIGAGAAAFVARGAFGLPLGVRFPPRRQREDHDPSGGEFVPDGSNRVASPLILRAVSRRNNNFTPCALLLPWWREILSVPLMADTNGKRGPGAGYRVWPDDPAARVAAATAIEPLNNNLPTAGTPDPLSAFLVYFSK